MRNKKLQQSYSENSFQVKNFLATQLHSLAFLVFLAFDLSSYLLLSTLFFFFFFALFLKVSSPHPSVDPPFSFFSTARALSFHASLYQLSTPTQIIISSISFQPSSSPATPLFHYFNHHHGKMVTSLTRLMHEAGSRPPLQKIKRQLTPGQPMRGLQICPSSVEFTSVRNMSTRVKRKYE